MDEAERWAKVERIFNHAADMPPSERCFYLDLMCGEDSALRKEVDGLLNAHTESSEKDWFAHVGRPTLFDPNDEVDGMVVQRLLGNGSIGEVYQVMEPASLAIFAIKCLSPIFNRDEQLLRRFQHEANLAQKLVHPTICKNYGFRESSTGVRYLLMEYCQGSNLAKIIAGERLPPQESLRIVEQVCLGLRVAHHHNIWHRDIKPTNIMVDNQIVKIVDFGIAKEASTEMTVAGTRLGSPAYMAPEQWRCERVDQRADIWQVGVMLFEMLTGQLPFDGSNPNQIRQAVMNETPPRPTSLNPQLSPAVDRFIGSLLGKDRAQRPEHIEDVLEQLQILRSQMA